VSLFQWCFAGQEGRPPSCRLISASPLLCFLAQLLAIEQDAKNRLDLGTALNNLWYIDLLVWGTPLL
jgi:hypothetical protein